MIYYIYKITCTKGKLKDHFYYGKHQTNNIDDNYKGSGKILQSYYKKYPNDYLKEIICFCNSLDELNNKEIEIISKYIGTELCLNIQRGGTGGDNYTYLSEDKKKERNKKLSLSMKNRPPMSDETRKKLSDVQKGRPLTKSHYENLCEAMKLRRDKETWMKGKKHKEESKQLISEHNWTHNPLYKYKLKEMGEKISQRWKEHGHPRGMQGKHQTEEAKEKRSKYKWLYKDDKEICVHEDQIELYIKDGYKYGRILNKFGGGNKGMKKMTNGVETLFVKPYEFDKYISNGWYFCFVKNNIS